MKTISTVKKCICLLLAAFMLLSVVGCNDTAVTSSDVQTENLWGNEALDTDTDDDVIISGGDDVIVQNGSGTTSSQKTNTTSGTTASTVYEKDEEAAKDYLASVPKSLRGKTVKVLIYWDPLPAEVAKAEKFEAETGIKIKWVNSGTIDNLFTKIASMKGSGQAADLAPIVQSDFPAAITQNYFQPLSVGNLDLSDKMYDIDTMDQFKYNGQYYGAMVKSSLMVTFDVIIFNKDLYKKYGIETPYSLWQKGEWNWDTFLSNCQALVAKGAKYGVVSDYGGNWLSATAGSDAVKCSNGTLTNNTKDANLVKGYQFVNDLKSKYKVMDGSTNLKYFKSQEAGMALTGNYIMQNGDVLDRDVTFNWGYAPAPSPAGMSTYVPSEVKLFGFPVGAKNPEVAGYWLRYWLDSTFEVEGSPTWSTNSKGVLEFNSWIWEQKKVYCFHKGVITKGGDYDRNALASQLSECGSENVTTKLAEWSGVIDSKIALINQEKQF